ncbi:PTS system mannose/fructose/N-acetylgalactosamine-transporter subunit IIB [Propionibacterium cyclohexanicum]|nr:PTS sugar transporter subunit IIB [Propionibacterium cyclohexanicum]
MSPIIAASDNAAHDELRRTLMLQVAPGSTKTFVVDIEKTARVYNNPKYADLEVLMVVETPRDVVRLLDLGLDITDVNVGGMTYKENMTRISEAVSVGKDDIEAFSELDKRGVRLTLQQLPTNRPVQLMDLLRSKGLL